MDRDATAGAARPGPGGARPVGGGATTRVVTLLTELVLLAWVVAVTLGLHGLRPGVALLAALLLLPAHLDRLLVLASGARRPAPRLALGLEVAALVGLLSRPVLPWVCGVALGAGLLRLTAGQAPVAWRPALRGLTLAGALGAGAAVLLRGAASGPELIALAEAQAISLFAHAQAGLCGWFALEVLSPSRSAAPGARSPGRGRRAALGPALVFGGGALALGFSRQAPAFKQLLVGFAAAGLLGLWAAARARRGSSWPGELEEAVAAGRARATALTWALPLVLALPGLLDLPVRHWDCSPWMDSQGYDRIGHRIALGLEPAGSSYYMPVYQYFLAGVYYLLGHVHAAGQLVNVALGLLTVVLVTATARELFGRRDVALLVGSWTAILRETHHAPHLPQIENLYLPLVALVLWAWARYLRAPGGWRLVGLGLAVGLVLNTRTQGAFGFAALLLAPLLIPGRPLPRRGLHLLAAGGVVALALLPWSARNYVVEGRLSPASNQPVEHLAVTNDPRIGLYGVRYELGWAEIVADYQARYPVREEREAAMRRDAIRNIFGDPARLARAVGWRTLTFYGLLPPGAGHPAGPRPTDWPREGVNYAIQVAVTVYLLLVSAAGAVVGRGRVTALLVGFVLGNLSVVLFVGFGEPRLSYPVLPVHLLLGACLLAAPQVPGLAAPPRPAGGSARGRLALALAVVAVPALVAARLTLGAPGARRALKEPDLWLVPAGSLEEPGGSALALGALGAEELRARARPGTVVSATFELTNNRFPPPHALAAPLPRRYFYAELPGGAVGVCYAGARSEAVLREGDLVALEGVVVAPEAQGPNTPPVWIRAERLRRVSRPE